MRINKKGFSLIEVIAAVAILSLGLVAVMQLFSGTLRTTQRVEQHSIATSYARAMMQEAYTTEDPMLMSGYVELDETFSAERTVSLAQTENGVTEYEITVKVMWPRASSVTLTGRRTIYKYEPVEQE